MKYSLITKIAIAMFFLFSCDDGFEEYNQNPNEPEVVPSFTIFNSATVEYTDAMRNSFSTGRLTLPWLQYWGQNSYADEDRFLYRETTAEGIYRDSYRVATDLKKVIELNTNEATSAAQSAYGNNNNQIAASRIMLAYLFHKLTDTFGDVPYWSYGSENENFQALEPSQYLSPVFAEQEAIYADILKELREASDQIVVSEPVFISGDNIFGNTDNPAASWKKFANSLILRVANRLRDVDSATANSAIDAAISVGVMTSNADNAVQAYETADATASPFWQAFIGRTDFGVTNVFIRALKGENNPFGQDPRLFKYAAPSAASIDDIKANSYTESTDPDDYEGLPYAFPLNQQLGFDDYTFPSSNVLKPDYGEVLMEYAEVQFIISEHNGFSQAEYEEGVRASMEKWGIPTVEIDAFVATLPPANQENVMNQKYIALYMQAHEAWAEYRRTGFPSLIAQPGDIIELDPEQVASLVSSDNPNPDDSYEFIPRVDIDEMPKRLRYPQILQTLNPTNRQEAAQGLQGGDLITSPLFWDMN